jgi:type I restriction enzyme S subunit
MEVNPGFRQTEVGVIPGDWEPLTIGDVCSFSGGSQPPRFTFKFVPAKGYIRLIQIRDYKTDEYASYIPEPLARKRCSAEDIMVGRYGPPIFQILRGIEGAYNVALIKATPNQRIDREFLYNILKQETLFQLIEARSRRTSGQTGVEMPALKAYGLPLPPLPEQRAIAEALSDVDALLAALDRLIAKKRDLKQDAMHQLLTGRTRLPGFNGEWQRVPLGKLLTFKNGLNKGREFFGFGTPIVNYMDVFKNAGIVCSKLEGRVSVTNQEIRNFDVRKGDVLFTRTSETSNEVGIASVILDDPGQAVFSGFVLRGRPQNEVLCDAFKNYCFRSTFVRKQIVSKASYTTRALTNGRVLSGVILPVPPLAEQSAIAKLLSDMDAELAALERRCNKTRALKQGMMQELLTGRIRLV